MNDSKRSYKACKRGGLVLTVAISLWAAAGWNRTAQGEVAGDAGTGLVAVAAAGHVNPGGADAARQSGILMRVNSEPVTQAEFERMLTSLAPQGLDSTEREPRAKRNLIHHRLILQEAARRSFRVAEQDLDSALKSLRGRFNDLRAFGVWMEEQGLDDRSLFQALRDGMLAARVRAALVEELHVTEAEVEQYYAAHKEELKTEDVWIQVIAVKERAAAEEIQTALSKGEDFGRLAQQRSLGMRATRGGDVGWVSSESLWPPMRRAVSTLQPGEAIGPLQRGEEFLVVRLHERRPGRTKSLDEARPEIEPRLLAAKQEETMQTWLVQQEQQASIEIVRQPE
jgi:parvulin-like peptidyl-prolyl isomerase